jgi:hypothetical protein
MEWSCALYRAVQEHGMSQADAAVLVETIMWDVYQPVAAALFGLSRIRSAKRETRVKWLLGMMTRRSRMALNIATSDGNSRHTESDPKTQDNRECPKNAT